MRNFILQVACLTTGPLRVISKSPHVHIHSRSCVLSRFRLALSLLVQPLSWEGPILPVLPESLITVLDSPVPLLVSQEWSALLTLVLLFCFSGATHWSLWWCVRVYFIIIILRERVFLYNLANTLGVVFSPYFRVEMSNLAPHRPMRRYWCTTRPPLCWRLRVECFVGISVDVLRPHRKHGL